MGIKIDIISGFLGAGKTTLIKKLLEEAFVGEKIAIIENEYGTVGVDGALLKGYDIQITELYAGCICCSISGDFTLGLKEILKSYQPERILIEPSGVSKLSDVMKQCRQFIKEGTIQLNMCIVVIDITKYDMYLKNFNEFYQDQISYAKTILLTRTDKYDKIKIDEIISKIRLINTQAVIITTQLTHLEGNAIVSAAQTQNSSSFMDSIMQEKQNVLKRAPKIGSFQVKKTEESTKENFGVWGKETAKVFTKDRIEEILHSFDQADRLILRAKGIVETELGDWIQFDYVPNEIIIKSCKADYIGRICVIGNRIEEMNLDEIFEV